MTLSLLCLSSVCFLALVTLLYWSLEIMAHNTLTWFTKYLSDLIWVVWGWGWRHSCHSSTSHKSFPRMVVRGLQGKGKFCHYHIKGEQSHFLFLKLHSSGTLNRNLWQQIISECKRRVSKRRESPDFQKLVSLMEGNMMVDVNTVKSKNDRLPKPPCLEMLLQSSLLRFKELI